MFSLILWKIVDGEKVQMAINYFDKNECFSLAQKLSEIGNSAFGAVCKVSFFI